MKIKELINALKKYNPDAEVTTPYSEDICLSYISKSLDGEMEYNLSNTPLVFIEQTDSCPTCVHEYTNDGIRMCSFYQKPCKLVEECFQYEEYVD